jgi:predicted metal-dependent HD superfamily phosphohydrolase
MLENKFKTLCQKFTKEQTLISKLWQEIKIAHSEPSRHYHTLKHLEHIYKELQSPSVSMEFAIFYHDIVYDAAGNDNEKQSAILCDKHLKLLNVPLELTKQITQLIHETKTHEASSSENSLFLDADLSILGSNEKTYEQYVQNVRKEYAIYEDDTYFTGRKKVLKMFLDKEKIYETKYFYNKYEKQARVNMLIEYNSLI